MNDPIKIARNLICLLMEEASTLCRLPSRWSGVSATIFLLEGSSHALTQPIWWIRPTSASRATSTANERTSNFLISLSTFNREHGNKPKLLITAFWLDSRLTEAMNLLMNWIYKASITIKSLLVCELVSISFSDPSTLWIFLAHVCHFESTYSSIKGLKQVQVFLFNMCRVPNSHLHSALNTRTPALQLSALHLCFAPVSSQWTAENRPEDRDRLCKIQPRCLSRCEGDWQHNE